MRRPGAGLLYAAALIAAAYVLLHTLGGREATAALTAPHGPDPLLGLAYVAASLALRVLAPVLALAAVLRAGLERVWPEPDAP